MSLKDIAGLCIIGVKRSRSLTAKAAWVATLAEHEEDEHLVLLKRALWWDTALQKRVPADLLVLCGHSFPQERMPAACMLATVYCRHACLQPICWP